jgi:hypothetical protein
MANLNIKEDQSGSKRNKELSMLDPRSSKKGNPKKHRIRRSYFSEDFIKDSKKPRLENNTREETIKNINENSFYEMN